MLRVAQVELPRTMLGMQRWVQMYTKAIQKEEKSKRQKQKEDRRRREGSRQAK